MRRLDFYKLTREKQERFLASTKGSAPPAPIVQAPGDGGRMLRWAGAAVAGIVLVVLVYAVGFGVLGSKRAVHGSTWLLVYAGLFFLIPYAALRAAGSFRGPKILPFKPGVYVFPMCLVDARDKVLRIHAMTEVSVSKASPGVPLRLSFRPGRSFKFTAADAHDAEMLNRGIDNSQEQVKHALATSDDSELTTLDPFYDAKKGWTSPIGPKEPLVDRAPVWRRLDWAFAAVCALILGPLLWTMHNHASDDSMFRKAKAAGSPEAYHAYLDVGQRHQGEVSSTLLPRAELAQARAKQTVEAIKDFIATHPHTAIDGEAQAALKEALVRELDKAKKGASLASLASFESTYPDHHLGAEVAAAKHELYDAAVARFKTMAIRDDAALLAFVTRLAKWLETKGPGVTMVFHREVSPAIAQADKLLASVPMNRAFGPKQVTKYFDPDAPQPKEADVVAAFDKSMKRVFSPDLIEIHMGQATDEPAQQQLAGAGPLVTVRYRYGWLGALYASATMKRAFAGIHVSGESTFTLPDQGTPLRTRIEIPASPKLLLHYDATHDGLNAPAVDESTPEPGVYLAQEMRALDHMASVLERGLLKPATK